MHQNGAGEPDADRDEEARRLEKIALHGSRWFFWIAGLSLVGPIARQTGTHIVLPVDLGMSRLLVEAPRGLELGLSLAAGVVFVLLAWQAGRRRPWAFTLGLALYALDSLMFVPSREWVSVAVHAFLLLAIWSGYARLKRLRAIEVQRGSHAIAPDAGP